MPTACYCIFELLFIPRANADPQTFCFARECRSRVLNTVNADRRSQTLVNADRVFFHKKTFMSVIKNTRSTFTRPTKGFLPREALEIT